MKVILASKSPRRKELLTQMGVDFCIEESCYQEDMTLNLSNEQLVKELAYGKAKEVFDRKQGDILVIGSDTIVVVDGKRVGKPKNCDNARAMLNNISDKSHYVFTGLAVLVRRDNQIKIYKKVSKTKVYFKKLSSAEIDYYISTGSPMDKAGAYGIQDYAGNFIKKIYGDYYSVVGLPVGLLYDVLKKENIL